MADKRVLYWQGLIANPSLLEEHRTAIEHLLNGDYKAAGLDLKKLPNHRVYSIVSKKKHRLIFTTVKIDGQTLFMLLEVLPFHDYVESRFLKPKVLRNYLEKNKDQLTDDRTVFTEADFIASDALPDELAPTSEAVHAVFEPVEYYNKKFIVFNKLQKDAQYAALPLIIKGDAGTGKTCVAHTVMEQAMQQETNPEACYLFYAQQDKLVRSAREAWEAASLLRGNTGSQATTAIPSSSTETPITQCQPRVDFMSETDLLKSLIPDFNPSMVVDKTHTLTWLAKYIEIYQTVTKVRGRPDEITDIFLAQIPQMYEDFRILCASADDYTQRMGKNKCHFQSLTEKQWLIQAFEAYRGHLEQGKQIHPAFHLLKSAKQYDLVVIDEAQDNSHLQLSHLGGMAKDGNIVYCVGNHQNLRDSNSKFAWIKEMLEKHFKPTIISLSLTYRCRKNIAAAAKAVMNLDNLLRGGSPDKVKGQVINIEESANPKPGTVQLVNNKSIKALDELRECFQRSADFVVVTHAQFRDEAKALFSTEQVFTPEEIKGLEYNYVVAYKLLETAEAFAANKCLSGLDQGKVVSSSNRAKADAGTSLYTKCFNTIITAFTRAKKKLIIFENELHTTRNIRNFLKLDTLVGKKELSAKPVAVSRTDQWLDQAKKLEEEGLIEQAAALRNRFAPPASSSTDTFLPASKTTANTPATANANTAVKNRRSKRSIQQTAKPTTTSTRPRPGTALPQVKLTGKTATIKTPIASKITPTGDPIRKQANTIVHDLEKNLTLKKFGQLRSLSAETLVFVLFKLPFKKSVNLFSWFLSNNPSCTYLNSLGEEKLRSLKNMPICNINSQSEDGYTVLHTAAESGNLAIMKLLLLLDPKLEIRCNDGLTPLEIAAFNNNLPIAELLVQHGAKVDNTSPSHASALSYAVGHKNTAMTELFFAENPDVNKLIAAGFNLLIHATGINAIDIVKSILTKYPVFLNSQNKNGVSPLHNAAHNGCLEIVTMLVEAGANINAVELQGETPLGYALRSGKRNVAEYLLDKGADMYISNCNGDSAIHAMAREGLPDSIALLLSRNVPVDYPNEAGDTALILATIGNHAEVIKRLLDKGANKHIQNYNLVMPLQLACVYGHREAVKVFLDHGAYRNEQSNLISTNPLILAITNNHYKVVKEIVNFYKKEQIDMNSPSAMSLAELHEEMPENNPHLQKVMTLFIKILRIHGFNDDVVPVTPSQYSIIIGCAPKLSKFLIHENQPAFVFTKEACDLFEQLEQYKITKPAQSTASPHFFKDSQPSDEEKDALFAIKTCYALFGYIEQRLISDAAMQGNFGRIVKQLLELQKNALVTGAHELASLATLAEDSSSASSSQTMSQGNICH